MAQADRADVGVGLSTIFIGTAAESLCISVQLHVAFNSNNCLVFGLQEAKTVKHIAPGCV